MKKLVFCFLGLASLCAFSADDKVFVTHAFYSNIMFDENAPDESHINFEGFINNINNTVSGNCISRTEGVDVYKYCNIQNVKKMLGRIHNILFETFYTCASNAPRAATFFEAVDGKHTPDSHHYASLIHSAFISRGVKTDFFSTPSHYGIHYQDPITSKELYWCIITAQSNHVPATNFREYIKIFDRYKNPEINGVRGLKPSEIKIMSADEFYANVSRYSK
ncbi:MAG TPA: hypothetical protein PK443_00960 [bacterium]|nr:hypothetical protein [bacterium]